MAKTVGYLPKNLFDPNYLVKKLEKFYFMKKGKIVYVYGVDEFGNLYFFVFY